MPIAQNMAYYIIYLWFSSIRSNCGRVEPKSCDYQP